MNVLKTTITFLACCCTILTLTTSALADFVGLTTVNKDDPDTAFLCTQGNGAFVPGPLTVCNVFAVFEHPDDRLFSVGNAELQVFNGQVPDVFFQHPFNVTPTSAPCTAIPDFPDLICDTFITIGYACGPSPPVDDATAPDGDWDGLEFAVNGHVVGGWFNASGYNGQGNADQDPPNQNLQVLFLQSSVARGLSLSGDIDIFWAEVPFGEVVAEVDVPVECAATCGSCPTDVDATGDTAAFDLAVLLGSWGPVTSPAACLDADGDGIIGAFDLAVLLGAWGPCP